MIEFFIAAITGLGSSAVATYFLKRYVTNMDSDVKGLAKNLQHHSEKMSLHQMQFHNHKIEMINMVAKSKEEFQKIEKSFTEKTTQILIDLRETKTELKSLLEENKDRKQSDKEVHGKIIMILNKMPLLENQYHELLREVRGRFK